MRERFMKPVLFACDPEKNVECPKTGCKHNPNAKYQACYCTTHSRFAKLDQDGDAIIAYDEMRFPTLSLWYKIGDEISYRAYCIRRKLLNLHNRFRC